LVRPEWSPDGRILVVRETETPTGFVSPVAFDVVIYPDGSCLNCQSFPQSSPPFPSDAAFTNNPTLLTAVMPPPSTLAPPGETGLYEFGVDGTWRKYVQPLVSGPVSDPVWSSRGELAVVEGGWVWVGRPAKLRRLTRGSAPSWSPDGRHIVFVRRGWVMIVRLRGRLVRRLVRGTAPAWSPDGRWVAFFDKRHRLGIVRARGGRVRRVGTVTGVMVDWQPLTVKPPAACQTPPGSTVIASSDTATVSLTSGQKPTPPAGVGSEPTWAAMGCLTADGRERWLVSGGPGYGFSSTLTDAAVAGNYAALAMSTGIGKCEPECGAFSGVGLFDLRTGASVPGRGGEGVSCRSYTEGSCDTSIDQLVLGPDAVSAAHTTLEGADTSDNPCTCTVEQIQASDSTRVHTLDTVTEPEGSPRELTNLILTGDTLTWEHNGSPRSAQLQP
jgi:hypothetical protein